MHTLQTNGTIIRGISSKVIGHTKGQVFKKWAISN